MQQIDEKLKCVPGCRTLRSAVLKTPTRFFLGEAKLPLLERWCVSAVMSCVPFIVINGGMYENPYNLRTSSQDGKD